MVSVCLLGRFTIHVDGSRIKSPRRKTRALLAYLAETAHIHHRRTLSDIFCREAENPAATLRLLLSRIRTQVVPGIIQSPRRGTVVFNSDAVCVDSRELSQALDGRLEDRQTDELIRAARLYRGGFLEGLLLPDAPAFELWLVTKRARFERLYKACLQELVTRLTASGQPEAALEWSEQLMHLDPFSADALARLMRLYAATGHPEAALQVFERYRENLRQQLAAEPSSDLLQLHTSIALGRAGQRVDIRGHSAADEFDEGHTWTPG